MRDTRESSETVTSYSASNGTLGHIPVNTINATLRTRSTSRDDSVSTEPNSSGAFYRPTTYRAWFYSSTSSPGDYVGIAAGIGRKPTAYWGRYSWSQYSSGVNTSTLYGCSVSNRPAVPAAVYSAMEATLNARIANAQFDVAQFLGELPETVRMIADIIRLITDLYRSYRNAGWRGVGNNVRRFTHIHPSDRKKHARKYKNAIRRAKTASSAYLALMYGVMPLMSEVYGLMQLAENGVEHAKKQKLVVRAHQEAALDPPKANASVCPVAVSWQGKVGSKGAIHFSVRSPILATLDSYGIKNPLGLAWELLPLSFVIDWFAPVSAFIQGLSGFWGLEFSHGYRTDYVKWNGDIAFTITPTYVGGEPAHVSGRLMSFYRSLYLSWPIPIPYVRGLSKNLAMSVSQGVSLLAIAIQRAT